MPDVLLIDTLSSLRTDLGFISPCRINAQLSGFLEQAGISFDVLCAIPRDDGEIGILRNNEIADNSFSQLLEDLSPRVVGLFHDPELIHLALPVAEQVRKTLPDALLCTGNSSSTAMPDAYLKLGFDYICGQDLFVSFMTVADAILRNEAPRKGLVAVAQNQQDLDHYPFIAKKFFDCARPQWTFTDGTVLRFGIILSSLGCTGACHHCHNSGFWGTAWRPMTAERIRAEIEFQRDLLDVSTFYLGDINFLPNSNNGDGQLAVHPLAARRLKELDERLPPEIRFIVTTRPDTISLLKARDTELLERYLRRVRICFMGVESYSSDVLSRLQRKINRQMIQDAIAILSERNISLVASFIVGSPTETPEELQETEQFILNDLPSSAVPVLNIMTPFPGTGFHAEMQAKGLILQTDVRQYNGQHLVFRHPVYQPGELEKRIQEFYYRFFTEKYTG
jgi:radical SAM superfamily enzyme YgiQ (UPF0313 family)